MAEDAAPLATDADERIGEHFGLLELLAAIFAVRVSTANDDRSIAKDADVEGAEIVGAEFEIAVFELGENLLAGHDLAIAHQRPFLREDPAECLEVAADERRSTAFLDFLQLRFVRRVIGASHAAGKQNREKSENEEGFSHAQQ